LREHFDEIGCDLDLDKFLIQALMFSEPSLEDPLEVCFSQSKCNLNLGKFLEQTKSSNEPSLEDPMEESFVQFEFDLDLDMIREQVEPLLDSTLEMQIENGKTIEISIYIPYSLAIEPLTVDNHEEEEEEQVEQREQIEPPNLSNDKEVSTEVHSFITISLETQHEP
jgi:hypothetical protein